MCTTYPECKTIMTVVLTIKSGLDPHMISWNLNLVWLRGLFGFVEVGSLGCGSVTMRLYDAIEVVTFS
jgi:hypothetical protein